MSHRLRLATCLLGACVSFGAVATAAELEAFVLQPIEGGYLRLESATGRTSTCTGSAEKLVCRATPDERAALDAEIGRLTEDNRLLKAEIEALKAQRPGAQVELKLPSETDVNKAMDLLDAIVKRFRSMIDDWHQDPGRSTPL